MGAIQEGIHPMTDHTHAIAVEEQSTALREISKSTQAIAALSEGLWDTVKVIHHASHDTQKTLVDILQSSEANVEDIHDTAAESEQLAARSASLHTQMTRFRLLETGCA